MSTAGNPMTLKQPLAGAIDHFPAPGCVHEGGV